ncbi:hypothetical protein A2291_02575 [candidate division WOR-1 bacterium RIFOXYB2_FULL_42_35]|uniref:Glycosyltransferase 2-like domain-containing protein n=1 Tax=candidate division WOR-1 bacterium RIFOXYC2_FULL_41_25 TaxID=1802586 RepID=A0A1F4TPL3_UNCSA|nr:MAG: hypothetical protein A2247_05480 [candidate division WOR-1 bacterium RIFOXYA2_FULL_41_14]OGC25108.1 MAG: hypothetical protein A2291_02575 [candidate division WOR-1 bacterium RIFOXYB2_FULL_42_35]OGC34509.1 MAG: hypothetical protein A2462_04400 [candidate division WOR-1 bacterium RIFOXYC2_FULL_41_25]OGC43358.1 MAG: hypothetical protein A2548_07885 [candidate division WOR-1 bacterium RIFOXYD2_FULL_41_8]OGE12403.1 MAG: hypothetical protein A3J89_03590 [Candidatus Curtissbacteria bacterium R
MRPFTLFLPVYNEEDILEQKVGDLLVYLSSLETLFEIIIVSNGSTDDTVLLGEKIARRHSQVKFFQLPQRGVGRAFKKGFSESRYDHIIFMDADLSADLSFIEKSNQLLEKNVLVLGAKIKGLQNRGIIRKLGSAVFYFSVLALMGLKYVDYAPGAKAYRRDFLRRHSEYIDDFTSFVLNLTFIAAMKKDQIIEIPIACNDRRPSRFNLFHEALSKYNGLLGLKFRQIFGKL